MTGLEMLLAEFDAPDLPDDLAQQFKALARLVSQLPMPRNLQALRWLLDARRVAVRAR
jgi:hypothetical protein